VRAKEYPFIAIPGLSGEESAYEQVEEEEGDTDGRNRRNRAKSLRGVDENYASKRSNNAQLLQDVGHL
jgi:hypothetical protein